VIPEKWVPVIDTDTHVCEPPDLAAELPDGRVVGDHVAIT